jgi:hypothetical protein
LHVDVARQRDGTVHRVDTLAHARVCAELHRAVHGLDRLGDHAFTERDRAVDGFRFLDGGAVLDADRAVHRGYIAHALIGLYFDRAVDLLDVLCLVVLGQADDRQRQQHGSQQDFHALSPTW